MSERRLSGSPNEETRYLTANEVVEINRAITGGSVRLRDRKLLESAVASPAVTMFGRGLLADIFAKGATLLRSIAQNQPFSDGNKRAAWLATLIFLRRNGADALASPDDVEDIMQRLASRRVDVQEIATFLRDHARPLEIPE